MTVEELLQEYQEQSAACSFIDYSNTNSIKANNVAVERMYAIVDFIVSNFGAYGVKKFSTLLDIEDNRVSVWAATHLLERMKTDSVTEEKALEIIKNVAKQNDADGLGYRHWLENRKNSVKELRVNLEEGFADITLPIVCVNKDGNGNLDILVKGSYGKLVAGVRVIVKEGMKSSFANGELSLGASCAKGITFVSIGQESDAFLKIVSVLYGERVKKFSKTPVSFTCLALEEKSFDLQKDFVHFKLFFEGEDTASELYCNINIPAMEVEVREKDPVYRKGVIQALSGSKPNSFSMGGIFEANTILIIIWFLLSVIVFIYF